jgi:hypothetical protein
MKLDTLISHLQKIQKDLNNPNAVIYFWGTPGERYTISDSTYRNGIYTPNITTSNGNVGLEIDRINEEL